jgi:hypothetical protein
MAFPFSRFASERWHGLIGPMRRSTGSRTRRDIQRNGCLPSREDAREGHLRWLRRPRNRAPSRGGTRGHGSALRQAVSRDRPAIPPVRERAESRRARRIDRPPHSRRRSSGSTVDPGFAGPSSGGSDAALACGWRVTPRVIWLFSNSIVQVPLLSDGKPGSQQYRITQHAGRHRAIEVAIPILEGSSSNIGPGHETISACRPSGLCTIARPAPPTGTD